MRTKPTSKDAQSRKSVSAPRCAAHSALAAHLVGLAELHRELVSMMQRMGQKAPEPAKLITLDEAATVLRTKSRTVSRIIHNGDLAVTIIGRRRLIHPEDLADFQTRRRTILHHEDHQR